MHKDKAIFEYMLQCEFLFLLSSVAETGSLAIADVAGHFIFLEKNWNRFFVKEWQLEHVSNSVDIHI